MPYLQPPVEAVLLLAGEHWIVWRQVWGPQPHGAVAAAAADGGGGHPREHIFFGLEKEFLFLFNVTFSIGAFWWGIFSTFSNFVCTYGREKSGFIYLLSSISRKKVGKINNQALHAPFDNCRFFPSFKKRG